MARAVVPVDLPPPVDGRQAGTVNEARSQIVYVRLVLFVSATARGRRAHREAGRRCDTFVPAVAPASPQRPVVLPSGKR